MGVGHHFQPHHAMIDLEKLHYPAEIVDVIGLSKNEINFLKTKGCPFFGRKTTVRWVREFIAKEAGAQPEPLPPVHPSATTGSKSGGPTASND